MQWFTHDRFGMFIHWGLYAIPARGEWVRSTEEIPEEDYIPFFNEFNPHVFLPFSVPPFGFYDAKRRAVETVLLLCFLNQIRLRM